MSKQINIYRNDISDYDSGHWDGVQSEYTFVKRNHSTQTRHGCVTLSRGDSVLHGVLTAPDNAKIGKTNYDEIMLFVGDDGFDVAEIMAGCVGYRYGSQYKFKKIAAENAST